MRERRFNTVGTARAASDQRNGDAVERFVMLGNQFPFTAAVKNSSIYGHLERERSRGRCRANGNNQC